MLGKYFSIFYCACSLINSCRLEQFKLIFFFILVIEFFSYLIAFFYGWIDDQFLRICYRKKQLKHLGPKYKTRKKCHRSKIFMKKFYLVLIFYFYSFMVLLACELLVLVQNFILFIFHSLNLKKKLYKNNKIKIRYLIDYISVTKKNHTLYQWFYLMRKVSLKYSLSFFLLKNIN